MRGSELVFDSSDLLHYNLHKISLNRGRSCIDSPKWLINKKATINPKNNDDKYFQYALTVALNYEQTKNDSQRISKIKPFIKQYDWKEMGFPSIFPSIFHKSIALNTLYVPYNTDTEKMRHAYKSKYDEKHENKVILLTITDGKNGISCCEKLVCIT